MKKVNHFLEGLFVSECNTLTPDATFERPTVDSTKGFTVFVLTLLIIGLFATGGGAAWLGAALAGGIIGKLTL